ncbi:unnamed protein product [Eruca vesicaria subsp. sativa]|uniref:Uncharacterized protein n=1 Tax=Eruca vesicaria subsp. sativa TaxID=29727 RepID=A0ABC8JZE6_ERUVS|nr:unnamed protein product [Eruca vesicaria subsp. sativa]
MATLANRPRISYRLRYLSISLIFHYVDISALFSRSIAFRLKTWLTQGLSFLISSQASVTERQANPSSESILPSWRSTAVTSEFLHNGLRRQINSPQELRRLDGGIIVKNPAAKRIQQEVTEMQANLSDDFMSLPLEAPPKFGSPELQELIDEIIKEAAEAVNVSPIAGLLATAEVAAKASRSGEQRIVRRASQKLDDDTLFTWAEVGITITITIVVLL